jgi:glycosyltransferase involved in cell wall biosynthesis
MAQTEPENVEVLVFDNASTVPAVEALAGLDGIDRVRIVRVEEALPMRDSWETALSLATGDFVTILGDDDALVPNAAKIARELVAVHKVDLLRWDRAHYIWPGNIDEKTNNTCKIPLGRTAYKVDGHKVLRELGRMTSTFAVMPMIYNSWVSADLIASIKGKHGRIFHSALPDVDSGFAFAFLGRWYLSLNFPLGICGQSPKSNGAQAHAMNRMQSNQKIDLDAINDFNTLNSAAQIIKADNQVIPLWELITQAYKTMAERLNIPDSVFKLDERRVIQRIIAEELPRMPMEKRRAYLERISHEDNSFKFTSQEKMAVERSLNEDKVRKASPPNQGFDPFEQILTINCDVVGIHDSASLVVLIDKLLGLQSITKCILFDVHPKGWVKKAKDMAYRVIKMGDSDLSHSKCRNNSI